MTQAEEIRLRKKYSDFSKGLSVILTDARNYLGNVGNVPFYAYRFKIAMFETPNPLDKAQFVSITNKVTRMRDLVIEAKSLEVGLKRSEDTPDERNAWMAYNDTEDTCNSWIRALARMYG